MKSSPCADRLAHGDRLFLYQGLSPNTAYPASNLIPSQASAGNRRPNLHNIPAFAFFRGFFTLTVIINRIVDLQETILSIFKQLPVRCLNNGIVFTDLEQIFHKVRLECPFDDPAGESFLRIRYRIWLSMSLNPVTGSRYHWSIQEGIRTVRASVSCMHSTGLRRV